MPRRKWGETGNGMLYAFGEFTLDTVKLELCHKGEPVQVEPKVFDILAYLVGHPDQVISRDELLEHVWAGRIVSDAAISSAIAAARSAIGDDGNRQSLIKTVHGRGFRFIGQPVTGDSAPIDFAPPTLTQDIRYCRSHDGTQIAYATSGEGPVIVKAANWLSHLEHELENPLWRHWIENFSDGFRLLRFDERGNGLSARRPKDVSFAARAGDLEAVIDAAAPEKFVLFGVSGGCAYCLDYAARHPERVRGMILYGGFPLGFRFARDPEEIEMREAMGSLIRIGWGRNNPAFRQLFTTQFMPNATPEQAAWFNELQRTATEPEMAYKLYMAAGDLNVRDRLEKITVPTLVVHAREDAVAPFNSGQYMAASIPGARMVSIDSGNHILMKDEPGFAKLMTEMRRFIAELD